MNSKQTVILLCRDLGHIGGVVNFCNSLLKYFQSERFVLKHFKIGKRPESKSNIRYLITSVYDYVHFFLKLFGHKQAIVHMNPSLGFSPILRDAVYLMIAKLHQKKVVAFWHGWDKQTEGLIDRSKIIRKIFRWVYSGADAFIVLASGFKEKFENWGFQHKIYVETTTVDDSLPEGFIPEKKIQEIQHSDKLQILFFSRIHKSKGVFETIEAFRELTKINSQVELVIAGDGPDLENVKTMVSESGNDRIKLAGYVKGQIKRNLLEASHLMVLPTSHGEGLPISILEAMAFAMPIITSPVGGIKDILTEGENVYYAKSNNSEALALLLKTVFDDRRKMAAISKNNYKLANEHFMSSIVACRIEAIYKSFDVSSVPLRTE